MPMACETYNIIVSAESRIKIWMDHIRQDSVLSGQMIIFHRPWFPWNKENSLPKRYLLGWKLVWGRDEIWPDLYIVTHLKFNSSPLKRYLAPRGKANVFQLPFSRGEHVKLWGAYTLTEIEAPGEKNEFLCFSGYRIPKLNNPAGQIKIPYPTSCSSKSSEVRVRQPPAKMIFFIHFEVT